MGSNDNVNFYEVRNTFNNMWHSASIHDPQNGQTSGINENELNELRNLLTGALSSDDERAVEFARKKLDDLEFMENCQFNKEDLKDSKPGFFESLFNKEKNLERENKISYDTMLSYNGDHLKEYDDIITEYKQGNIQEVKDEHGDIVYKNKDGTINKMAGHVISLINDGR